jgi:hypothetical protein
MIESAILAGAGRFGARKFVAVVTNVLLEVA